MKWFSAARLRGYALVTVGCALTAAAFGLIILPQEFAAGGVTGLAMLTEKLVSAGVPLSARVLGFNLVLFWLGWAFVGKEFVLKSLLTSLLFPTFLEVFRSVGALAELSADPFLSALLAGAMLGCGAGLVLLGDGSNGGFDILGVVLNRKFQFSVSNVMYLCDGVIIACFVLSNGLMKTAYGIVVILAAGVVTNRLLFTGKASGEIMIFSRHHEAIREELLHHQDVGMTFLHGETGYRSDPIKVIVTVVPHKKMEAVKRCVYRIDPTAFLLMDTVRYVGGRGYTLER